MASIGTALRGLVGRRLTHDQEKTLVSIAETTAADAERLADKLDEMSHTKDPLATLVHAIRAASFRRDVTEGRHGWPRSPSR